jgi:hypothetical protein
LGEVLSVVSVRFAGGNVFSPIRGRCRWEVSGVLVVSVVRFERRNYFSALPDGGGLGVLEVSEVLEVRFEGGIFFSRRDSRDGMTQGGCHE